MPQKDVENLLIAASISKTVASELLRGQVEKATYLATHIVDQKLAIDLTEEEVKGLRSIIKRDLPSFAQECIDQGLVSGGRERL